MFDLPLSYLGFNLSSLPSSLSNLSSITSNLWRISTSLSMLEPITLSAVTMSPSIFAQTIATTPTTHTPTSNRSVLVITASILAMNVAISMGLVASYIVLRGLVTAWLVITPSGLHLSSSASADFHG